MYATPFHSRKQTSASTVEEGDDVTLDDLTLTGTLNAPILGTSTINSVGTYLSANPVVVNRLGVNTQTVSDRQAVINGTVEVTSGDLRVSGTDSSVKINRLGINTEPVSGRQAIIDGHVEVTSGDLRVSGTNNFVGVDDKGVGYVKIKNSNTKSVIQFDNSDNQLSIQHSSDDVLTIEDDQVKLHQPLVAGAVGATIGTDANRLAGKFTSLDATSNIETSGGALTSQFIRAYNTGLLQFQNNSAQTKMVIRNDGNVGIGTTAPDSKLHVNGKTQSVEGFRAFTGSIGNASESNIALFANANGISGVSSAKIVLRKDDGHFCYGCEILGGLPFPGSSQPDLTGTEFFAINQIAGQGAPKTRALKIDRNTLLTRLYGPLQVLDNFFYVGSNGKVGIGLTTPSYKLHVNGIVRATSFSNSSDDRIKYNEQLIAGRDALSAISQVRIQKYDKIVETPADEKPGTWIPTDEEWAAGASANFETKVEVGVIAQEMKQIPLLAHAVQGEELDEDGNETPLNVDYQALFCTAIAAIQELKTQVETLQSDVATLKAAANEINMNSIVDENEDNQEISQTTTGSAEQ